MIFYSSMNWRELLNNSIVVFHFINYYKNNFYNTSYFQRTLFIILYEVKQILVSFSIIFLLQELWFSFFKTLGIQKYFFN